LILVINVGNLLGYEAVKYVIGNKLDIADVGGYTLIATIAVYAGLLVRSISSVLTPAASRLESLGQKDNQRLLASLSTKYAMVVAGFACIVPLFLIRPLLHFWVGGKYPPEYLDMLAVAGAVLLGGEWFISTAVCVLQMFTGTAKIKVPAVVTLLWAVCGLCLAWAYIQFVEKSLMAAVVIITVARITGSVVHLIYGIWVFELRKGQLLGHSIFKPLVAAVLSCVPCLFVARFVDLFSLSGFLLVGTTLTILYAGLVWAMVLDHSEREEIVERVRHLFAGAGG
jgi:O-antigen/teichoic acid export membrane protein